MRVPFDAHAQTVPHFDIGDMLTLLVHQEVGDANRRFDEHFAGAAAGALLLNRAQDRQGKVIIRTDEARAVARMTRLCCRLDHARAQTLARHLHQTKSRNAANLDACAVGLELVFDQFLNSGVVATLVHVDEVDDDQPRKVTQAQLARNFGCGFKVGLERSLLNAAFFGRTARVHVNRD